MDWVEEVREVMKELPTEGLQLDAKDAGMIISKKKNWSARAQTILLFSGGKERMCCNKVWPGVPTVVYGRQDQSNPKARGVQE